MTYRYPTWADMPEDLRKIVDAELRNAVSRPVTSREQYQDMTAALVSVIVDWAETLPGPLFPDGYTADLFGQGKP